MSRYTMFLVLGLLAATAEGAARGISMLQTASRSVMRANLELMSNEVISQVKRGTITPEVKENIDKMIGFCGQIEIGIHEDHDAAQTHYNALVDALQQMTDALVGSNVNAQGEYIGDGGKKHNADTEDRTTYGCFTAEHGLITTWKAKWDDERAKHAIKLEKCAFTSTAAWEVPVQHFKGNTDATRAWECEVHDRTEGGKTMQGQFTDANLAGREKCPSLKALDDVRAAEKLKLQTATREYSQNKVECDVATAIWKIAYFEMVEAWNLFEAKRVTCAAHHYNYENSMCQFGDALQEKCDAMRERLDFYEKVSEQYLIGDTLVANESHSQFGDETNTAKAHSEPDRIKEWGAVKRIRCLLTSYRQSPEPGFDSTVNASCMANQTLDYDQKVGEFDYQLDKVAKLTRPHVSFDCTEASITFGDGVRWSVDHSRLNAEGVDETGDNTLGVLPVDYLSESHSYTVENDETNGDAFAFCNVNVTDLSDNTRDTLVNERVHHDSF